MSIEWGYYDKFDEISDKFLPSRGEGDNAATQAVTAVTKLVYKWYNDGDVYDNNYGLSGWVNNLSSYANWLYYHADGCGEILRRIKTIGGNTDEYEKILKDIADLVMNEEYLDKLKEKYHNRTVFSIYDYDGIFEFTEDDDEDEEEDDYFDYDEDEDYEEDDEEDDDYE